MVCLSLRILAAGHGSGAARFSSWYVVGGCSFGLCVVGMDPWPPVAFVPD